MKEFDEIQKRLAALVPFQRRKTKDQDPEAERLQREKAYKQDYSRLYDALLAGEAINPKDLPKHPSTPDAPYTSISLLDGIRIGDSSEEITPVTTVRWTPSFVEITFPTYNPESDHDLWLAIASTDPRTNRPIVLGRYEPSTDGAVQFQSNVPYNSRAFSLDLQRQQPIRLPLRVTGRLHFATGDEGNRETEVDMLFNPNGISLPTRTKLASPFYAQTGRQRKVHIGFGL